MNLEPGAIVLFDYLHIALAEKTISYEGAGQMSYSYKVPGKPRLMVVLANCGPDWVLLLKLTGTGPREERHRRYYYRSPLGPREGLQKTSYLLLSELYKYPHRLAREARGKLDRMLMDDIRRCLFQGKGYLPSGAETPGGSGPPVVDGGSPEAESSTPTRR